MCETHPGRPREGEHACTCGGAGAPCPRSNVPENDKAPRCRALRIKISKFLQPAQPSKPAKVKLQPKPPRAVTRIPAIEKKIGLGLQLLDLRSKTQGNIDFDRLRRKLGVEPVGAQEALRVARVYGRRPEIYRRLSWQALVELSSPHLSVDARTEIEAKIIAGDRFSHTQIRARRPLRRGPPNKEPAPRIAA